MSTLTETGTGVGFTLRRATLTLLRIGAGLLFMQHGVQKLFGWLGGVGPQGGTAELFSLFGLAGIIETFGGLAMVLGILTRPIALLIVFEMLGAYFIGHHGRGGFPIQNGGELSLLYALVWALIAAHGPGALSVDSVLARRRSNPIG